MSESIWHDLGPLDGFENEKLHGRMIEGIRLCFGRAGEVTFAMDDTCPHAGGSLIEGMLDEDLVICPLHAYAFEIASGRCIDDPTCSVSAYATRVEGGMLQVRI